MTDAWRPPHAYVPGQSLRHPEALFDDLKSGLQTAGDLSKTQAWRIGLTFLEEGFFWEAHEVLEAVWMACPQNSAEKMFVQAVIQQANAGLKDRMGRPGGRDRLLAMAESLASEAFQRAQGPIFGFHSLPEREYAK